MDEYKDILFALLEVEARNTAEILELQKAVKNVEALLRQNQKITYNDINEPKEDARARKGCGKVRENARPVYLSA